MDNVTKLIKALMPVKINVQGFEVEVLKGAKNILNTKPKLAIAINPNALKKHNSSVEDLFDLIDVEKYNLWVQLVQWHLPGEEPRTYDVKSPITQGAHLFALPKQ